MARQLFGVLVEGHDILRYLSVFFDLEAIDLSCPHPILMPYSLFIIRGGKTESTGAQFHWNDLKDIPHFSVF